MSPLFYSKSQKKYCCRSVKRIKFTNEKNSTTYGVSNASFKLQIAFYFYLYPHSGKTHGLSQKIQGTYFKISALYFKIYALYFSPFQISE